MMIRPLRSRLAKLLFPALLLLAASAPTWGQRLEVSPRLLTFPCTLVGERPEMTVRLQNRGSSPLDIRGFEIPPGSPFIIPNDRNIRLGPNQGRTITIRFAPSTPNGTWDVQMKIIAGRETDSVRLRGRSSVAPRIDADPSDLNFRTVPGNDTTEQCVIFENPSCRPAVITGLTLTDLPFRFASQPVLPDTLREGERRQICIELLPGPPGPVSGRLRVQSNQGQDFNIDIEGTRAGPGLVLVPLRGLDFDRVAINTISPQKRIGIVNRGITPENIPDDWEVLGPDAAEFTVTPPPLPAQLAPLSSQPDTLWFTVRFSPASIGKKIAQLRIGPQSLRLPPAPMRGEGTLDGVRGLPHVIDMGFVLVGGSRTATDTLVLTNLSRNQIALVGMEMTGADPGQFIADGPPAGLLNPGNSFRYSITFTPADLGGKTATVLFHLRDGGIVPVRLLGSGAGKQHHTFRLDTVTADVGERFDLHVRTSPDLTPIDGVTSYTITLRFDPAALFLHRSTGPDGVDDAISHPDENTVVLTRNGTGALNGPVLARLQFEGLASGRPENLVELASVALNGGGAETLAGNGMVLLVGCDISRGVGFGRPIVARGAWPSPAGDQVTIRYLAPAGSQPSIRIIDLTGHGAPGPALPEGTGAEQEAAIPLSELHPGFYMLELRCGTGRSSLPVVIER